MSRQPAAPELHRGHWWPAVSVLTVITYNTWLLWKPLNGNPRIFDGYISELSASDQPYSLVFRTGDLVTALLVLAMGLRGIVLWRRRASAAARGLRPPVGRWWLVGSSALLIFGTATFVDAFFAMDCSPTLSESCRRLEESGQLSTLHYGHTFTSVGAQVGILISMIGTYIALVRSHRQVPARRRVVLVLSVLEVAALTTMMTLLILDRPGLGYPQAAMIVIATVWFAAIGFRLIGDEADRGWSRRSKRDRDLSLSRPRPRPDGADQPRSDSG